MICFIFKSIAVIAMMVISAIIAYAVTMVISSVSETEDKEYYEIHRIDH